MSDLNTQLLMSINTQLGEVQRNIGAINAQLEAGSKRHKEFSERLDIIDRRTDIIEDKTVAMDSVLTPKDGSSTIVSRIQNLELFQGKMGAIITGGSFILWGIGWFIYQTVAWVGSHWVDIKEFFKA